MLVEDELAGTKTRERAHAASKLVNLQMQREKSGGKHSGGHLCSVFSASAPERPSSCSPRRTLGGIDPMGKTSRITYRVAWRRPGLSHRWLRSVPSPRVFQPRPNPCAFQYLRVVRSPPSAKPSTSFTRCWLSVDLGWGSLVDSAGSDNFPPDVPSNSAFLCPCWCLRSFIRRGWWVRRSRSPAHVSCPPHS